MKNLVFFLFAFIYSSTFYSQDSSSRSAVGKTGDITKEIPGSENDVRKKDPDQFNRNAQPVKTNETIPQQVTGDFNDKNRNAVSEKTTQEGPK